MTFPVTEEPTRTRTRPRANNSSKPGPPRQPSRAKRKADLRMTGKARIRRETKPVSPRPGSKAAKVLALLKRPQGASLKQLLNATGWQPHSIRGFLSGTVGRKLGLKISSIKTESGGRRYAVKPDLAPGKGFPGVLN